MSEDELIQMPGFHRAGIAGRGITQRLGRAPSTISRELSRNATPRKGYRTAEAHRRATARRARFHRRRVEVNIGLADVICDLLAQR